tara:strand:- start:30 stop:371 length:342 start_codon:yes stop_codon:yes gene_type:complete
METAQTVFGRLKEIKEDNKALWQFAQEHFELLRKLKKLDEQMSRVGAVDLEDKEGLRKTVLEHLFAESAKGNAQASDKLAKLAGLGEEEQDIIIEVVNYNPPKVRKKRSVRKK